MQITHPFVSALADGFDATLINPSNWNAVHTMVSEFFTATEGQVTFTTAAASNTTSWVFVNGVKQRYGASYDFIITGGAVVFNVGLLVGSVVEVIQ